MLRDSVRRFLADHCEPGRAAPPQVHAGLAELGLLALPVPEDEGGLGGRPEDLMLVMEEFGRALAAEPYVAATLVPAVLLAALDGSGDLLGAVADGSRTLVLAHEEAAARGRVGHVETMAARTGSGFRLDGAKAMVVAADRADTLLVTARSADGAFPGIGVFAVPAEAQILRGPYATVDGFRAADVVLDGHAVAAGALLDGDAGPALQAAADAAIMAVCAEAAGAMDALLALTNDYLKTRRQFGVAIGSFQALQHRMADMYVDLEQVRSMLLRGTAALSLPAVARTREVSAAKALIGRLGKAFGAAAVQLHGGIGVSEEHMAGRYFRRLVTIEAQYGNSDFHLARFAAADQGGIP